MAAEKGRDLLMVYVDVLAEVEEEFNRSRDKRSRIRHRERSPRSAAIWWGRGSGPATPDCFAEPRNDD